MYRQVIVAILMCLAVGNVGAAEPDGSDFDFWVENTSTADTTSAVVVAAWRTDAYEGDVQGWSWGVCHDEARASIGDCAGQQNPPCEGCPNISCPPDMIGPGPGGQDPDFHALGVYPGGVTQGVVLSFMQAWELPSKSRFELLEITYTHM